MFEVKAIGPIEWFASLLQRSTREANILVRMSDGHLALADLRIHNFSRDDGHWEIEVKTDGEWIPGLFHPNSQTVKVWSELRHH